MKKLLFIMMFLYSIAAQAQFIGVNDSSSQNRFLGLDVKSCTNKDYSCGNDTVSGLLNIDFFSPSMFGKQLYLFNDFIYWIGAQYDAEEYNQTALRYSGSQLEAKMNKDFPAPGTYMIVLGTSLYLKKIIAPTMTCPSGQWPLMAQLKYNDGNLIYAWSQDAICLAPHTSFSLQISSDIDNTVPASADNSKEVPAADAQGIDWMKNLGPNSTYAKASGSPRKIRLIKSGS